MRKSCPLFATLALASLAALAACSEPAAPPASPVEAPSTTAPAATAPARPPFPNMATAAWGEVVVKERAATADASEPLARYLSSSLQALHALDERAATALQQSAASLYAKGEVEGDRALAAALLAVGLVLDENPVGFRERLIDAHGVAVYAGTLEGGTAVAQAARAFIAIATGRVYEGDKLVDIMSTATRIDADTALLLALSRFTMGQRNDQLLGHLEEVLKGKPESARARGLLARTYLDLGLVDEVVRVLDEAKAALGATTLEPTLELLRVQALFLRGDLKSNDARFEQALAAASEVQRGEALYRLALAAARSGDLTTTEAFEKRLATLTGFARETALLGVHLSLGRGDAAKAKAQALEVCNARNLPFAVAYDCLWSVAEACAALGDEKCVDEWGKKAVGGDDDFARLLSLRARLAAAKADVQKASTARTTPSVDASARELLAEAHLLSPFDPALAKQVGLAVVRGGAEGERVVRGARRAIAFGAKKAAEEALAPLVRKDASCRVCRALYALAAKDVDEAARRAVQAVAGSGPALSEQDLIAVIDALGGSPIDEAKAALRRLERDPRPRVREAVVTAQKDHANPEGRAARKAEGTTPPPAPGTVPVPAFPGAAPHEGHVHHD